MVALFTKSRGNDTGNVIAMTVGFIVVAVMSNLPNELYKMCTSKELYKTPEWLPVIEFTWRIMFGTIATALVALCFRSKQPTQSTSPSLSSSV
jgi:Na+/proline symporter